MRFKYYIIGILSNVALLFYSLPWTYGASRTVLGFYLIAFAWFVLAWLPLLIHLFLGIAYKINKNPVWKHHLIAAGLIAMSYAGFLLGMCNGYVVTA